jgi:hypothetical protein
MCFPPATSATTPSDLRRAFSARPRSITRDRAPFVSAWLTAARTPPARRGHIRQYTNAKTSHVPFALDGMYYREFPTMFDWVHNGASIAIVLVMHTRHQ